MAQKTGSVAEPVKGDFLLDGSALRSVLRHLLLVSVVGQLLLLSRQPRRDVLHRGKGEVLGLVHLDWQVLRSNRHILWLSLTAEVDFLNGLLVPLRLDRAVASRHVGAVLEVPLKRLDRLHHLFELVSCVTDLRPVRLGLALGDRRPDAVLRPHLINESPFIGRFDRNLLSGHKGPLGGAACWSSELFFANRVSKLIHNTES